MTLKCIGEWGFSSGVLESLKYRYHVRSFPYRPELHFIFLSSLRSSGGRFRSLGNHSTISWIHLSGQMKLLLFVLQRSHLCNHRITSFWMCLRYDIFNIDLSVALFCYQLLSFFYVVAHVLLSHNIVDKTVLLKRLTRTAFLQLCLELIFTVGKHLQFWPYSPQDFRILDSAHIHRRSQVDAFFHPLNFLEFYQMAPCFLSFQICTTGTYID